MKPIIVGMNNPYGARPEYALYPEPVGCSGWRLCHMVLGLTPREYLTKFDRMNLCQGDFRIGPARARAVEIAELGRSLVLLGAKVCEAFKVPYYPFTKTKVYGEAVAVIIPHPSGLNRQWGLPKTFEDARAAVMELLPEETVIEAHVRLERQARKGEG